MWGLQRKDTQMRQIGFVTLEKLSALERRGMDPKAVVDGLISEGKRRSGSDCVILQKEPGGFSIVAMTNVGVSASGARCPHPAP